MLAIVSIFVVWVRRLLHQRNADKEYSRYACGSFLALPSSHSAALRAGWRIRDRALFVATCWRQWSVPFARHCKPLAFVA